MRKLVLCLTAALFIFSNAAQAKTEIPPAPTSGIYVQDNAGVLSGQTKQEIDRVGKAVREKTKAQIVAVTVDRLEDTSVEEYALGILRGWGVGDKERNNGVVLLVSVKDRQSRIEVGYGLEGALPDGRTGEIQDRYMIPYFQNGDYNAGILNGYRALAQAALQEYGQDAAETGRAVPSSAKDQEESGWLETLFYIIAAVGIVFLIILDFIFFGGRITMLVLSLLNSRRGGGGGGFGGGSGGGGGSSRKW